MRAASYSEGALPTLCFSLVDAAELGGGPVCAPKSVPVRETIPRLAVADQ